MGLFDKFKKKTDPAPAPQTPPVAANAAAAPAPAGPAADESAGKRPAEKNRAAAKPAEKRSGGLLSKFTRLLFTDVRDLFKKEGRLVDDVFSKSCVPN